MNTTGLLSAVSWGRASPFEFIHWGSVIRNLDIETEIAIELVSQV